MVNAGLEAGRFYNLPACRGKYVYIVNGRRIKKKVCITKFYENLLFNPKVMKTDAEVMI
jgi:hypothetical protein